MPFSTDGASSPVLDDLIGGPAAALTAVALVATPGARTSGWAARAAVGLAARWPGSRRVVLADLDLVQPALHEAAGVPNEEGVVDLIDFGLSLERLVRRAPEGAFDVLPAGPFSLDSGAILQSPAWDRVLHDLAARRSTLLAWVPLEAAGAESVIRRAGAVLILAEDDDGRAAVERLPHPYSVLAILVSEGAASEIAAVPAPEAAHDDVAVVSPASIQNIETSDDVAAFTTPLAASSDTDAELATPTAEPEAGETSSATGAERPTATPSATPADAAGDARGGSRLTDDEFERIRVPKEGERAALIAELRDRQRAARLAGEPGAEPLREVPPRPTDEGEPPPIHAVAAGTGLVFREVETESRPDEVGLETLTPPRRAASGPVPGRYRHALVWTAAVVLLTSLLAGAWHFLSGRLAREGSAVAATSDSAAVPADAPEPRLAADALPFVVAIEAHRDLALAVGRIVDLADIEPDIPFHIEPVERDGVLYYHVMGGPVPDSVAALALRDTLISRGHKTGRTPTDVRATPFAFFVGDYATQADADEQADVLRRLDIPGYVLPASAADGEPVYRLYVGGFGGEAEAGAVGQMLRAAGIRDTLVTRTGAVRLDALRAVPDGTTMDSTATGGITP